MEVYSSIDRYSLIFGFSTFFIALFFGFFLLRQQGLKSNSISILVALSALGHCLGALFYYWYSLRNGSDSLVYFHDATQNLTGVGFNFVCFVLGNLKKYLFRDSLLSAFLFSGALGTLGSIYYLLTYQVLLKKTVGKHAFNSTTLFFPSLILLCWPSYFLWSAGLIKDNFTFLFTGILFFELAKNKPTIVHYLMVSTIVVFLSLMRPYLFLIFTSAMGAYLFFRYLNTKSKLGVLCALIGIFYLIKPEILNVLNTVVADSGMNIGQIGDFIIYEQALMQEANASLAMPTYNPNLVIFFLPYFILINLFLPLGVGAAGVVGWVSTLENLFFLCLVMFFIANYTVWKKLKKNVAILQYFWFYFLIGIACLSILNINLGLAMREKMLYVPPLLIIIMLVYSYKKLPQNCSQG